jgi:outer membrane protein assembly factor BamB
MPRICLLIVACCVAALSSAANAAGVRTDLRIAAIRQASDAWPQLLHDNAHTGVSSDQSIGATTASTLGIKWMSAMRSADLGSPVVAANQSLGKSVVYVGDERGDVLAFDLASGASIWSKSVGAGISVRATPLIAPDGSVWVATAGSNPAPILKLSGATGETLCSFSVPLRVDASVMLATPPGGAATIYVATEHTPLKSGTEVAADESNCSILWSTADWLTLSGAWATPSFAVDANGKGRVYVGTADPDSTEYAMDALTGAQIWNYSALNPPDGEFDIGAAATISPPGNNGFADGVLYFPSKYGVLYALDLTTGKRIWQFNFNQQAKVDKGGRSSAALYKTTLVYGLVNGVEAVNAVTGKLLWHYISPSGQEVLSSPAIAGPPGNEIVAFGDASGLFTVLRLSDGKALYSYQTGNFITASPAIIDGNILIDSSDGFLYDFAIGGSAAAALTTTIASPANGSKVPNPGSTVTIAGTANGTGGAGVSAVQLSVQRGGPTGPWFNATTGTWANGAVNNVVPVSSPGSATSAWSFTLPVLGSGSSYTVVANAVGTGGQADRTGAQAAFAVQPSSANPQLTASSTLTPPGSTFAVSGGPFAPNEIVDFSFRSGPVQKATASSSGAVTKFPVTVPTTALFGLTTLTATGETSHKSGSVDVDIANFWAQAGYSAAHTAYEPHDPILDDTLQATMQGYLSAAWTYDTGSAIDTSPAVSGGVAYVANSAGALTAVDTFSGSPLWTSVIPTTAPIVGAPALANGVVFVGGEDGNLYRFGMQTGKLIGTIALDGVPTSPTLTASKIYVGTDNGTVYAIDEATGNELWTTSVGAAIHQPPTVNPAGGALFVGDDAGHISKLNPATGALITQLTTGGAAVTATPSVSGSFVLVGSADGDLRAFNLTTGTIAWTYSAGSPIEALASTGYAVYFGTAAGAITKLAESNAGYGYSNRQTKAAIIGIAYTSGVAVMETASGALLVNKDNQEGRIIFDYGLGDALDSQPVIVDGTVYVGAGNGSLYAFTTHGQAPDAIEHRVLAQVRASAALPGSWMSPRTSAPKAESMSAFAPHGPRVFAVHVDRTKAAATGTPARASARGTVRTFLLGWGPVAVRANAYVERARAGMGTVAGFAVDTAPYPRALDDAAVQREIARAIAANGWRAGLDARFVVLTAASPLSAHEYCSYHSAFDLGGALTEPVIYGVVPAGTSEECGSFGAQISRESNELLADPFVHAP